MARNDNRPSGGGPSLAVSGAPSEVVFPVFEPVAAPAGDGDRIRVAGRSARLQFAPLWEAGWLSAVCCVEDWFDAEVP